MIDVLESAGPDHDARAAYFDRSRGVGNAAGFQVAIGDLKLSFPVMPASGCFGPELGSLLPAHEMGASVTKTVFATPRHGNDAPRVSDTAAGMINSVGIPSAGPEGYLADLHQQYVRLGIPTIISVGAHRPQEFAEVIRRLGDAGAAFEMNVSCPNLDADGIEIGADPRAIFEATAYARAVTSKPLIVKLAPMVTSIADCAEAAEKAGADAVCVSNSLPCLAIDSKTLHPILGNEIGGLTGPALRPLVLRLVRQCVQRLRIPVIGCGGIRTADDALEYFAVGASAVQVGTATLGAPFAATDVIRDLRERCQALGVGSVQDLVQKIQHGG